MDPGGGDQAADDRLELATDKKVKNRGIDQWECRADQKGEFEKYGERESGWVGSQD